MKGRLILSVTIVAVMLTTVTWAAGGAGLFIDKCGSCHTKGGQAAPVNPADKAGVVWSKYFTRGRHPVDLSSTVSSDELASVLDYLVSRAADSDQPEAAAIPK